MTEGSKSLLQGLTSFASAFASVAAKERQKIGLCRNSEAKAGCLLSLLLILKFYSGGCVGFCRPAFKGLIVFSGKGFVHRLLRARRMWVLSCRCLHLKLHHMLNPQFRDFSFLKITF